MGFNSTANNNAIQMCMHLLMRKRKLFLHSGCTNLPFSKLWLTFVILKLPKKKRRQESMDQCDILFIHACPTAAVIYYYTQLYQSHCLYCPHTIQVSVRELGRNLLHILDSVSYTIQVQPFDITYALY
jgi:hypothetical protein